MDVTVWKYYYKTPELLKTEEKIPFVKQLVNSLANTREKLPVLEIVLTPQSESVNSSSFCAFLKFKIFYFYQQRIQLLKPFIFKC